MNDLYELKQRVLEANKMLKSEKLVILTWGNVSEYDEEKGVVAIKASGIAYDDMTEEHIVIVDLDGNVQDGKLRPSTDCDTHLVIYKRFRGVKAVVHTHSMFATVWAQAGRDLPILGTTHADYFAGSIPCTRAMTKQEIENAYEKNTGKVIAEAFDSKDPLKIQAVLVREHGPFVWGSDARIAVEHAVILENIAHMAWCNAVLSGGDPGQMDAALMKKHYERKFGANAYYGQK